MRILIIGGTQLSGPFLSRQLLRMGHEVTLFHRGNHLQNVPVGAHQIIAPKAPGPESDRYHLREFAEQFYAVMPDVVIHMIAFTREDAEAFVNVFAGRVPRAVVPSSSDVYRAMGIINRTEPGPPIPVPINEDAPQREKLSLHGAAYEKRWVEQVMLSEPKLPVTILRYPAIYGPGTYRRQEWIKRMLDNRPAIILSQSEAQFRFSHSYAEDIGWATALAATKSAASRVFNVGEANVPTERQRLEHFARVAGWKGRIVEVPDDRMPGSEPVPDFRQHWLLDTTRIRRELGFAEISDYEAGIRATIEWQKSHPNPQITLSQFDYAAEDRLLLTV